MCCKKKIKSLIMFILLFAIVLTACTKDDIINKSEGHLTEELEEVNDVYNKEEDIKPDISDNIDSLTVYFLDVGQADAVLLESDGHFMLIDAGNNDDADYILNFLKAKEVGSLDFLVGTHPDEDHIGSLDMVIENLEVKKLLLPKKLKTTQAFEDILTAVKNKNLQISVPKADTEFIFHSIPVEVIAPVNTYSDANNNSIVLKVVVGEIRFLFTGDIEAEAEGEILDAGHDLSADVLKVAHHGSETSSTDKFIEAVSPRYAIISVGKDNPYGHPDESVISRLDSKNIKVFRTDQNGAIMVSTDGKNLEIVLENASLFQENEVLSPSSIEIEKETFDTVSVEEFEKNEEESPSSENDSIYNSGEFYIGNLSSRKFHKLSCSTLPGNDNQIVFEDREEAIAEGYVPCKRCKP